MTTLSAPWRAALEEAWTAYCEGSYAIGACIADENGKVLARGRNRLAEPRRVQGTGHTGFVAGHDLAHAEINALLDLQVKLYPECYGWTVYTTVEPCPQCAGAVAMSSVRGLSYAAPGPERPTSSRGTATCRARACGSVVRQNTCRAPRCGWC